MRLSDYIEAHDGSQVAFARRCRVPQQTISEICRGAGCRVATAIRIVEATGGLVTFADLAGEEYGARSKSADTGDSGAPGAA